MRRNRKEGERGNRMLFTIRVDQNMQNGMDHFKDDGTPPSYLDSGYIARHSSSSQGENTSVCCKFQQWKQHKIVRKLDKIQDNLLKKGKPIV